MKKAIFLAGLVLLMGATLAFAGPTVSVVKSDNHDLSGSSGTLACSISARDGRPPGTPESEAYIEKMVRQAVDLAGGLPVKAGDSVCIKVNLVQDALVCPLMELTKNDIDPVKYPVPDRSTSTAYAVDPHRCPGGQSRMQDGPGEGRQERLHSGGTQCRTDGRLLPGLRVQGLGGQDGRQAARSGRRLHLEQV